MNADVGHYLLGKSEALRGGVWRLRLFTQDVQTIPIPPIDESEGNKLAAEAEQCSRSSETLHELQEAVCRRMRDLCPAGRPPKLTSKLNNWWMLDFAAFRAEIKKQFKADIPVAERNEWESYLKTEREKVDALARQIADLEAEIDQRVYKLFELTPEETKLLEDSLQGQY